MSIVRFYPRFSELFPNSKIDNKKYLEAAAKALIESPEKNQWEIKEFPRYPLVKVSENHYLVLNKVNELGAGAVGAVFRCRHLVMKDNKLSLLPFDPKSPYGAIKLSNQHEEEKEMADSYAEEVKILNKIGYSPLRESLHFRFGSTEHKAIPMRFISGSNLQTDINHAKEILDDEKTDPLIREKIIKQQTQKIVEVFDMLLQTIQFLYAKGMAHLDIQATNIILETIRDTAKQEHFVPRLVDFQLAKAFEKNGYATVFMGESKSEAREWKKECDISDDRAVKLSRDKKSVYVHKDADLYDIGLTISLWIYGIARHLEEKFVLDLQRIIENLQVPLPGERNIEATRKQLAEVAERVGIKLTDLPFNPFESDYKEPAFSQYAVPMSPSPSAEVKFHPKT